MLAYGLRTLIKFGLMARPKATFSSPLSSPDVRASVSRAASEVACLVFSIEAIQWIVPLVPDMRAAYLGLVLLILTLLSVCHFRDRAGARELGFRFDNLLDALARLALPLGGFVLLVVSIGLAAGTLHFGAKFFSMLEFVPAWALVQQYMLMAFVNRRLRLIAGERSALWTAALFAFLHLPNPILVLACAFAGFIWAREYERAPNLFAIALTHAVASAFLANSLPRPLLKNLVTGYNYFFR